MAASSHLIFSHTSLLCNSPRFIICHCRCRCRCPRSKTSIKHLSNPNPAILQKNKKKQQQQPHSSNIGLFLFGSRRWRVRSAEEDFDVGGGGEEGEREYELEDEEEDDEAHNWNDYESDYNDEISPNDFSNSQSGSFVNTRGWKTDVVVHHKINQDEFHKIRLLHCDFFIRKATDPDDDVFDFREMYATPPEMDVYSIPEVVGKMPDKYVRLRKTDYGCYNVIELPVDRARDDFAKTEFEVMKVFLMKHHKNKRADDPEFVLDFEEIYVIDSKAKSISRANVVVNVLRGKNHDRRDETLIVRDQGTSFKIIPSGKRDSHDVVIEKLHWENSRKEIETYLRSFRDFDASNWF